MQHHKTETDSRYKVLNRDAMKYLALLFMFVGHMISWINIMEHPDNGAAVYELPAGLQILAESAMFCPPVMFFFIADGYKYTRDRKKYALRLLIFACITQPFDWLVFQPVNGWRCANMMFTLFLGLLAIMAWESGFRLWQRILLVVLCDAATVLIFSDWLIFGVLFILALHIFRDSPGTRFGVYSVLVLLYTIINILAAGNVPKSKLILPMTVMFVSLFAAYFCMTTFYNGKKGRHPDIAKWFFYGFYPLHYVIILFVKICMDKI